MPLRFPESLRIIYISLFYLGGGGRVLLLKMLDDLMHAKSV
jgi:hypothetical protein